MTMTTIPGSLPPGKSVPCRVGSCADWTALITVGGLDVFFFPIPTFIFFRGLGSTTNGSNQSMVCRVHLWFDSRNSALPLRPLQTVSATGNSCSWPSGSAAVRCCEEGRPVSEASYGCHNRKMLGWRGRVAEVEEHVEDGNM